jgi:membrane protein implicated in regulation of membrane protease activity
MSQATVWWILAGASVALELLTGTLYLLMLALGFVAGALVSYLGLELPQQIVAAALTGGLAVVVLQKWRPRPSNQPAAANSDVNLDIGATVQVEQWLPDGSAQVKYRGAQWRVVLESPSVGTPQPGAFQVTSVQGSQLRVRPV